MNDIINYIENPQATPNPDMENNINELISVLPPLKGGYSRKKNRKISRRFTKKRY